MRHALVTGGNRGIGYAIAEGLIVQGHRVTITARDADRGRVAASALGCDLLVLDLEEPASLAPIVDMPIDILVNNAGVLPEGSLIDNPEGFFQCMQVMVNAPFLLIRGLAPGMASRGWGRIVNLSSDWGSFAQGLHGPNGYGIAKAALNALTKTMPRDLPPAIKINAMCPGWVATRMGGAGAPRSPAQGADTAIWLATLPDNGPTGGFFRDREPLEW